MNSLNSLEKALSKVTQVIDNKLIVVPDIRMGEHIFDKSGAESLNRPDLSGEKVIQITLHVYVPVKDLE